MYLNTTTRITRKLIRDIDHVHPVTKTIPKPVKKEIASKPTEHAQQIPVLNMLFLKKG